jgi:DUF1680 family protein
MQRMSLTENNRHLTRRAFAASAAAAGALTAQTPPNPNTTTQRRGTMPDVAPFEPPLAFTRRDVTPRVTPFPMTQVRLLDSRFKEAQDWNQAYIARLPAERLVHNFRLNAGLDSSATSLGGWEEPKGELRGHFTGHFLSASALLYASTGDKEAKSKADFMVDELARCQHKLGGGYLSAFPAEFWDRLDRREKVWAPYYTVHKIMAGMFDMYRLTGNRQALTVLEGMAEWADQWTAPKSEVHMQDILETEYGGMNEVLYNLAAVTDEPRWANVGDRFTKKRFFNPLALRRDELRGLHVNTHIPQVIGAARRYEISGDNRFHDVADYFWYEVTSARSYVTGGTSNGEGWLVPPRMLAAELQRSSSTAECCCVYNMLKLTRHLYSWKPDPRYFDYYERVLLNHRLGTIRPQTGATMEDQSFWCCTGTGVEEYAKLNDSIYWQDEHGIYVNLFIPSELAWAEKGLHLRQTTKFPEEQETTLTFSLDRPSALSIRLRIPEWAAGASVKVNGVALEASAEPASYLTISRVWSNMDRIEMTLPMQLRSEAMPDDPSLQAFLYGPVVLAGDLGTEGLSDKLIIGPSAPRPGQNPIAIPAFRAPKIQPGDRALTFRTSGQTQDVSLVPLNSLLDRRYSVYWKVA